MRMTWPTNSILIAVVSALGAVMCAVATCKIAGWQGVALFGALGAAGYGFALGFQFGTREGVEMAGRTLSNLAKHHGIGASE